jgi:2-keto-4-pentenoate hydratase
MGLSPDVCDDLAARLLEAERTGVPIGPLTEAHPDLSLADAYAIQQRGRALRVEGAARLVGHKVGLTSQAMQDLLGVDQPDFGYLTDAMVRESGAALPSAGLIAPRVEAEIAFRIGADLSGPGVDRDAVLAATTDVAPCLEVVDSRVADWRIRLADTVADNASSGLAVFGAFRPLADLDLAAITMTMDVTTPGGVAVSSTGRGSAVLGHPADAVAWLVRTLAPFGEGLHAGEVVIPGAMAAAVNVSAGAAVSATFSALGDVTAHFE